MLEKSASMQGSQDTDQHQAITLKHLSPTWVKELDEEVGRRGMFCDLLAVFRGWGKPVIARITEDWPLHSRKSKTND